MVKKTKKPTENQLLRKGFSILVKDAEGYRCYFGCPDKVKLKFLLGTSKGAEIVYLCSFHASLAGENEKIEQDNK